MRQKIIYLLLFVFALGSTTAHAEVDSLAWKRLVISEVHFSGNQHQKLNFLEVANMTGDTVFLEDYWFQTDWTHLNGAKEEGPMKKIFTDTLLAGETFILTHRSDITWENEYGELLYPNGYYHEVIDALADWSTVRADQLSSVTGSELITTEGRFGVFYRGDTSTVEGVVARDSVMVDRFMGDDVDGRVARLEPIAGVQLGHTALDGHYVRKTLYNRGNDDWDESRGTNLEDSEWIVLPRMDDPDGFMPTTLGVHKNQTELEMTPKNSDIIVDETNMVVKFPYGIRRDSVFRSFTWGDNHAYELRIGADTSQWYITEGDSLDIYVVGDELKKFEFACEVAPMTDDFAQVRPLTYKPYWNPDTWTTSFTISEGLDIDTIGDIAYSLPVDSFFKYMVVEEGATAEIIWHDGVERPELLPGNKLKVTHNGGVKEYTLSINRFAPNHNADLNAIILSGYEEFLNEETFEFTDTIMPFTASKKLYIINLLEGTEVAPPIVPVVANSRATTVVTRPKSLDGGEADRTATILVIAEDDTTRETYNILFNVERETPPIVGTPFFSEVCHTMTPAAAGQNLQVFNPNDEDLFLSDYVIMRFPRGQLSFDSWTSYAETGENSMLGSSDPSGYNMTDYKNGGGTRLLERLNKYITRPGYMLKYDDANDAYWEPSPVMTKEVLAPKEVYSIVTALHGYPIKEYWNWNHHVVEMDLIMSQRNPSDATWSHEPMETLLGYEFYDDGLEQWPYGDGPENDFWLFANEEWNKGSQGDAYIIAKIVNDSIIDGTKPVNKDFLNDYEIVDMVHGTSLAGTPWKIYDTHYYTDEDTVYDCSKAGSGYKDPNLTRRTNIYTGNPIDGASFGSPGNPGEWLVYGIKPDGGIAYSTIEGETLGGHEYGATLFDNHVMLTYAHIPYLTSSRYIVGKGLTGVQPIIGVEAGTDVDGFLANVDIADTAMTVVITSAAGVEKVGAETITSGDKVSSTSANGETTVEYEISVGALDNATTLTAKSGSGLTIDGLTVKGIVAGTTLKDLLDNVEGPATARILVTDGEEQTIPMDKWPADTIMVEERIKVDVLASTNYVIEVTAQNGKDRAKYALEFADEDEVYVLSDVYTVLEDFKTINFVWGTNVDNFLSKLVASPGASMKVVNKLYQEREMGSIQFDDKLVVTKGDVEVVYTLKFSADERWYVGLKDTEKAASELVYPNPTADGLVTLSQLEDSYKLVVTSISGQVISTYQVDAATKQINLEGKSGLYLISVYNNDGTVNTLKVVKQ